jgi:hypothetical protein
VVSLINYRFVPLQFRVLFANVIALFWWVSSHTNKALATQL